MTTTDLVNKLIKDNKKVQKMKTEFSEDFRIGYANAVMTAKIYLEKS